VPGIWVNRANILSRINLSSPVFLFRLAENAVVPGDALMPKRSQGRLFYFVFATIEQCQTIPVLAADLGRLYPAADPPRQS